MQKKPKVFFDANVMIQAGKPPGGPIIDRVCDLVKAELIDVITTDLTITEIFKKHAANDYEVIKEIGRPHFRKIVTETIGTKIASCSKADLKDKISQKYEKLSRGMFKKLKAEILSVDDIKPSTVFEAYAREEGFFSQEGKRSQFPDAFIFECLKKQAGQNTPLIIVSNDGDFDQPVKSEKYISVVKSFPDLFTTLGLKIDAPEVDAFLREKKEQLMQELTDELAKWSLQGDVEDSEIDEAIVTNIEMGSFISFGSSEISGSILAVGTISITADVSYTHPDWDSAAYDSEDKVLIPFDDVSGETEVQFDADVSISISVNKKGDPKNIAALEFRNDNFLYLTLHPYDPYS